MEDINFLIYLDAYHGMLVHSTYGFVDNNQIRHDPLCRTTFHSAQTLYSTMARSILRPLFSIPSDTEHGVTIHEVNWSSRRLDSGFFRF